MKSLTEYLLEAMDNRELITSAEEAIKYLEITDDLEKEAIKKMYEFAQNQQTKNGEIAWPIVKNYENNKGVAFRRWVETNTDFIQWANNNDFDISKLEKGKKIGSKTSKGYHNTKLQDVDEFPNSTDHEILIAMSLNMKSGGEYTNPEKALMYAMFGEKGMGKEGSKSYLNKKQLYDKFLGWYKNNDEYVKGLSKDINVGDGELFAKLNDNNIKAQKDWKQNDESERNPNSTPKVDILSNKGRRISCKNGDSGAQAMSGSKDETMATLLRFKYLLKDDQQKKLESLFKDENGNSIDWNGKNKERNKKLNNIIKEIFGDEENSQFVTTVIAESITGSGKFGPDSNGSATEIITYSKGKCFSEDAKSYIYHTVKEFKKSMVTINTKSSNSAWANLRILLNKHTESYEKIDGDIDDMEWATIDSVMKNEKVKKLEIEKTEIDGKSVIIKTGPKGGKYYITNGNKIYVSRNEKTGKYQIKS